MAKRKTGITKHIREFKQGERVSIIRDRSVPTFWPKRILGLTGKITGKRGNSYIVTLNQGDKEKQFIVKPIHLKKLS